MYIPCLCAEPTILWLRQLPQHPAPTHAFPLLITAIRHHIGNHPENVQLVNDTVGHHNPDRGNACPLWWRMICFRRRLGFWNCVFKMGGRTREQQYWWTAPELERYSRYGGYMWRHLSRRFEIAARMCHRTTRASASLMPGSRSPILARYEKRLRKPKPDNVKLNPQQMELERRKKHLESDLALSDSSSDSNRSTESNKSIYHGGHLKWTENWQRWASCPLRRWDEDDDQTGSSTKPPANQPPPPPLVVRVSSSGYYAKVRRRYRHWLHGQSEGPQWPREVASGPHPVLPRSATSKVRWTFLPDPSGVTWTCMAAEYWCFLDDGALASLDEWKEHSAFEQMRWNPRASAASDSRFLRSNSLNVPPGCNWHHSVFSCLSDSCFLLRVVWLCCHLFCHPFWRPCFTIA